MLNAKYQYLPSSFHIMVKPRGPVCNLDCTYCYYLKKENLYSGSRFQMSEGVLEEFTRQYLTSHRVPEITFTWQGGESTLMGLDFFKKAVFYQNKHRQAGQRVTNALQTNATTLNEDWIRFFKQHNFLIGVSLDGPRDMHDAFRLDKGGRPTHQQVESAVRKLQNHGVEYNILATVNAANGDHPLQVYRYFRDHLGAKHIQFIPIVEQEEGDAQDAEQAVTEESVHPEQYGRFLTAVFGEWVRHDVGEVFVQLFDTTLARWLDQPGGLCIFQETCGEALALEHNGDLYSCDHFVEPEFLLGNITKQPLTDLIISRKQFTFGKNKRDQLPETCRSCEVLFACNGGCPKNRFLLTSRGDLGLNYLCPAYKLFFTTVREPMNLMADLIRRREPPRKIMKILD
jgi:uncharacterized protein